MAHEEAKHLNRVARLGRIKTLAEKQGNDEMLGRVNKLMEREQKRYEQKMGRIKGRMDKVGEPVEKGPKEGAAGLGEGKGKVKKEKQKAEKDEDKDAVEESDEKDE